jgi:hypothetical protein
MNSQWLVAPIFVAALVLGALATCQREGKMLTDRYHHLGNDTTEDWKEADPKPEGKRLELKFESRANAGEWTLYLEQRSIDDPWRLRLNGAEFARLRPAPGLLAQAHSVPAGLVREGANLLAFVPDQPNDDVVIGKVRLVERSLREIHDTQPVLVSVLDDGSGAAIPARVSIFDAAGLPAPMYYAESPGTAVRDGVLYVSVGQTRIELPRGTYVSHATRGVEWSASRLELEVRPDTENVLVHRLRRELDTRGFVAADTHIHTLQFSGHGDASAMERQVTLAGEGVEFAVATDHNHQTDYGPFQRELGLSAYFTAVTGNEVTTDVGHFNAFPLDPAGKLPDHRLKDFPQIVAGIRQHGAKVVILNHPRWPSHEDSPFANHRLHRDTGAFGTGLSLTMDATELVNSTTVEEDPVFLFTDWFALLNRGVRIFAVGSSDSHTVGEPVGGGRTWVSGADEDPSRLDVDALCRAIREGHTSIGMGMFATVKVNGSAAMGETLAAPLQGGPLRVELRLQAPSWASPRRALLFQNGALVQERPLVPRAGAPMDEHLAWDVPLDGNYDRHLVCVVVGDAPGPSWPTTNPYTLAATNPVFVDVDGGGWSSPRETAAARLAACGPGPEAVARALVGGDDAVALHLLDLYSEKLRSQGVGPAGLREALAQASVGLPPAWERTRRLVAGL